MDPWSLLFWKGFMQDPEKPTSRMRQAHTTLDVLKEKIFGEDGQDKSG